MIVESDNMTSVVQDLFISLNSVTLQNLKKIAG